MTTFIRSSVFVILFVGRLTVAQEPKGPINLLVRCDDIGMNHTVNQATKQLLESGLAISTSVMFACPWYQEAVEILKQHPHTSVGVHLTLNAEWRHYRWGPVAGAAAV
ncbi:MAG: ChbG/HpnK family deacetylase, partial [Bacteroidota bacterium]